MTLRFDVQWIVAVLLLSVRLGAFLWATPLFALGSVPVRVRVMVTLVFAVALSTLIPSADLPSIVTIAELLRAMLVEVFVGALLGFGLMCSFAAFQFGGRVLDLQMGFGVATLINPSTNEHEPLLGSLLLAVGVMTFFLVDGHHWVSRGLVQSLEWFPLGTVPASLAWYAVVAQFGVMFTLGTVFVAPVVAVLLLIDAGLAMASRTMPQMNIFMISIPAKIVVGLIVLAASAPFLRIAIERILESSFGYWRALVS